MDKTVVKEHIVLAAAKSFAQKGVKTVRMDDIAAGYPIKGLPVAGFDRKNLLKNVSVLFKLVKSQLLARKIIKDFKPHAAVGVGGYASGPTLKINL